MGNSKSKKAYDKQGKNAFDRQRYHDYVATQKANPDYKRHGVKDLPSATTSSITPASKPSAAPPANLRSFDEDAIERIRHQLHNDSDAFLLNNILLSVQFFEHYER